MKPVIVGITGGSGSGKTTFADRLSRTLGQDDVLIIQHDSYYRTISKSEDKDAESVNYDHPDSLETDLLIDHLKALIENRPVLQPVYDFKNHCRLNKTFELVPRKIIILEGILILSDNRLRDLLDYIIFIVTDESERLRRRMKRDIAERGRSAESIEKQFSTTVMPMHRKYVDPFRRFADIIVHGDASNDSDTAKAAQNIRSILEEGSRL
jgi:uridine kinase